MLHKRRRPPAPVIVLLSLVMLALAGFLLSLQDIPVPVQPVEQELDAKAILTPKE